MKKEECGNCAFYRDDHRTGWKSGYGDCLRNPTKKRTNDGKWCGEHKLSSDATDEVREVMSEIVALRARASVDAETVKQTAKDAAFWKKRAEQAEAREFSMKSANAEAREFLRHRDAINAENERLRKGLKAIRSVVSESCDPRIWHMANATLEKKNIAPYWG